MMKENKIESKSAYLYLSFTMKTRSSLCRNEFAGRTVTSWKTSIIELPRDLKDCDKHSWIAISTSIVSRH